MNLLRLLSLVLDFLTTALRQGLELPLDLLQLLVLYPLMMILLLLRDLSLPPRLDLEPDEGRGIGLDHVVGVHWAIDLELLHRRLGHPGIEAMDLLGLLYRESHHLSLALDMEGMLLPFHFYRFCLDQQLTQPYLLVQYQSFLYCKK